jgi:predicted GTPase
MEAYSLLDLGLGEVIPTSPMQTRGLFELKAAVAKSLREG